MKMEESASQDTTPNPRFAARCCTSCFPCFGSGRSSSWETVHSPTRTSPPSNRCVSRSVAVLKKVREWSEIAAGPKWKTFIRRFNRGHRSPGGFGKFQYDPLSYSLNFDEGPRDIETLESVNDNDGHRDFTTLYVAVPASTGLTSAMLIEGAPAVS